MRAPWLDWGEVGLAWRLALAPLDVLALVYGAGARCHRGVYDAHLRRRRRLSCRVISVGSLTVGGSGKTPLAAWIALQLRLRGRRVALATRGYGRVRTRGSALTVVSDGKLIHGSAQARGDEPLLLAAQAPGVPVIVAPDRGLAGLRAVALFGAEVLVLDDGFQHHRLARDLEIVCFDGAQGLGGGRVLPRGPLREPLRGISRADAVGIVDGPLGGVDAAKLTALTSGAFRFEARRRPLELRSLDGKQTRPPARVAGMAVGLLSGVARPAGFRRTVEALGASVVAERHFPDHHRYKQRDLLGLSKLAPLWLTTEKDALKILPDWCGSAEIEVLTIGLEVEHPGELVDWVESRLARAGDADAQR